MTDYAVAVTEGREIAGPWVRAACARHLRDMQAAPARGFVLDLERVQWVVDYFREVLRLNGGQFEGSPFVLRAWQVFIVGSIFGWVHKATGCRRFRVAFIEIGKGNGKSPMAAGIGLICLTSDDEPRAEVYAAATTRDQAMVMFRDAVAMVDQSPELHSRLIKTGRGDMCWNISYPRSSSFFRVIAGEDKGRSGPRPHCTLIDEVHEHPNATLIDKLAAGTKGRRQPLQVEITNSGIERQSVCYQHHEYSIRVATGAEDNDEWFGYVCALDEHDDPLRDEGCWPKANPNLGVSIQPEYLRKQAREALGMPAKQSIVRRLNFCQWVDAANPWIEGELWRASERDFDALAELADCDDVCGALDLSGARDLTALALAGEKGGRVKARVEFWTPLDTLRERALADRVPYDLWAAAGHLAATPGRAVDYRWVAERIRELQLLLPGLRRIAFDPYRIKYLEKELDELNIEVQLVPHPQGYYKPAATKGTHRDDFPQLWMPRSVELLEGLIVTQRVDVQANPVLTWNSASAVLEPDRQNNRIFTKRKSLGRIDGIVTLAMAVGLLLGQAEEADGLGDSLLDPITA